MLTSVRSAFSWRRRSGFLARPGQQHTDVSCCSKLNCAKTQLIALGACVRRRSGPFARNGELPTPLTELGTKLPREVTGEEFLVRARQSSIFPDATGRRVMNGAVGVQKLKPQADGSVPTRQRFI